MRLFVYAIFDDGRLNLNQAPNPLELMKAFEQDISLCKSTGGVLEIITGMKTMTSKLKHCKNDQI